jgi:Zn-dependent peptidase ImmA (M78 family)
MWDILEGSPKTDTMFSDGSFGYTHDGRNVIVLNANQSESKRKVTMMHELMHAARYTFQTGEIKKGDYEAWEHHFINIWENSLLMILRDNPDLTAWLLEDK